MKYNIRKIKKRRSYTAKEIAGLFGLHPRTVQQWVSRDTLKPIDGSSNPYLIYGEDLTIFLDEKRQKRKCTLQDDEFYCLRCRQPRRSLPENVTKTETDTKVGKEKYKLIKNGVCQVCGTKLYRFYTYKKTVQLKIS
jgi:transcriptional regulator with XRE-family HTH domain